MFYYKELPIFISIQKNCNKNDVQNEKKLERIVLQILF